MINKIQSNISPRFQAVEANLDNQIDAALSAKQGESVVSQSQQKMKKKKPQQKKSKKKKKSKKSVNKLKNSLDVKALSVDIKTRQPKAQPRHVVLAFMSIAWEAAQRSEGAFNGLKLTMQNVKKKLEIEQHDMNAWLSNQKSVSMHRIRAEEERIGRMMDEITYSQHVYQDAVAKERAYHRQIAALTAERQLQTTPPLMPSVAAATLTDKQYSQSMKRLEHFRTKALHIMQRTAKAITEREHLILLSSKWVRRSKRRLAEWEAQQKTIIKKRVNSLKIRLKQMGKRAQNFQVLMKDALAHFNEYRQSVIKLDIKSQLKTLDDQMKAYKKIKVYNKFDQEKIASFLTVIKLEIKALKKKLKQQKGKDTVISPPPAWGVLASYHPTHPKSPPPFPVLHLPLFNPPSVSGPPPPKPKPAKFPVPKDNGYPKEVPNGIHNPQVPFVNPYSWQTNDPSVTPFGPSVPTTGEGALPKSAKIAMQKAAAKAAAAGKGKAKAKAGASAKFRQVFPSNNIQSLQQQQQQQPSFNSNYPQFMNNNNYANNGVQMANNNNNNNSNNNNTPLPSPPTMPDLPTPPDADLEQLVGSYS